MGLTRDGNDESITLEDPTIAGVTNKDILESHTVLVAATATSRVGKVYASKLTFSGRALPNSFVTVYVFSQPVIVTVKTDITGAWSYTLDKELPDGSHKMYSAITDGNGKILAKSEPLAFIKEAAAVNIGTEPFLPSTRTAPGFFTGTGLYALIAIVIGVLGVTFSIVGLFLRGRAHHTAGLL